jgi:hypothetical protein
MYTLHKGVLVCCLLLTGIAFAQPKSVVGDVSNAQQFMNDANGRPLYMHSEYEVEGDPFYHPEFCTANIKIRKGKTYKEIRVKLNLFTNHLIFDGGDGKEMEATVPVERIEFTGCPDKDKNRILVNGYPPVDGLTEEQYYVLLDTGKLSLLKYIQVIYRDTKYYGKVNTTRVFEQKPFYYVYEAGKGMQKLAKNKDAVLALLASDKENIQPYIDVNKLNCRKEEDLLKVFGYYNTARKD